MNAHRGGCHCGNLRYVFETRFAVDELPLRACQCPFCLRHAALSTSDPEGSLRFEFKDEGKVTRYVFGLRTADFLICAVCGVYVGAVMRDGADAWAIVNARTLDEAAPLKPTGTPMDYDAEDREQRIARRKSRWTPVVV